MMSVSLFFSSTVIPSFIIVGSCQEAARKLFTYLL